MYLLGAGPTTIQFLPIAMSGFMLIAANSASVNLQRQQLQRKKHRKEPRLGSHLGSTSLGSLRRYNTGTSRTSLHSLGLSKRMVYDINKGTYVRTQELSAFEKRVEDYEHRYERLCKRLMCGPLNEKMNTHHMASGDLLLTIDNVDILRYSFYERFTGDLSAIRSHMAKSPPKYLQKLPEEEDFAQDIHSQFQDRIDLIYQEYASFDSDAQDVRLVLRSNQFWNNVYQDIKFDHLQVRLGINYFDLLPNVSQTLEFFNDLIDFFLTSVQLLQIDDVSELSPQEQATVAQYYFFYFKDRDHANLTRLSKMHHQMYLKQLMINVSLGSPVSATFSFDRGAEPSDLRVHRDLMSKLISTMVDNLKNCLSSPRKYHEAESTLSLWRQFLEFLIFELIIDESIFSDISKENEYPEPNLDYDYAPTIDSLTSLTLQQPQPRSLGINRNISISSRSTSPSTMSLMSSPKPIQPPLTPSSPQEDVEPKREKKKKFFSFRK